MLRGIGVQDNFFEQLVSYGSRPGISIGVTYGARIAATQADEHHGSALPAKGAVTLWRVGGHGEKAHRGFRYQAL